MQGKQKTGFVYETIKRAGSECKSEVKRSVMESNKVVEARKLPEPCSLGKTPPA
jgi:hypothetical protein